MSESAILISSFNNKSTDKSSMVVNFPFNQSFNNKELALSNLIINYSWFSITSAYGNNKLSYIWIDGSTQQLTFPDGFYRSTPINDINSFIQLQMKTKNHYLVDANGEDAFFLSIDLNITYYAFTLTCTPVPSVLPNGWTNPANIPLNGLVPQLVVSGGFKDIIGFAAGTYPSTNNVGLFQKNSDFVPQVSPTSAIIVSCNLVSAPGLNIFPSAIAVISPTVGFGSQIIERPSRLIFFPVANGSYSQLIISFTDQNNRPLIINDMLGTVVQLIIRDKKK